ncbi:MAG: PAS domain S-box protein [Mariprofundaceae bacterium]
MSDFIKERRAGGDAGPVFAAGEAYLAGILKRVLDAIIIIDDKYRILIFNRGAENAFGYREGEVLGRPLEMLISWSPRRIGCLGALHQPRKSSWLRTQND